MMRWLQFSTRRACLFGALLAVLTGCSDSNDDVQLPPESTFETAKLPAPVTEVVQIPQEPVVGTVTPVSGAESTPAQMTGGAAVPLGENGEPDKSDSVTDVPPTTPNSQIVLPRLEPVAPPVVVPENIPRFTEIAPDTIGGATYQSSPAYEYGLGNLVAMTSRDSTAFSASTLFVTPIKGWVRYPEKAISLSATTERFPIIIFLHGQHDYRDPSYRGYDYLAEDLAQHGYVVLSIDANAINGPAGAGDQSGQSRAQLVLGTLDRLRQINGFGQIDMARNPGKLDPLKGKLDFDRIGLMGHSRGGQGIANAILFNKTRRGVTEADLKATVLVASPLYHRVILKAYFKNLSDGTADSIKASMYDRPALKKMGIDDATADEVVRRLSYDFKIGFPDLAAAVIPAVKATPAKPAVEAEPAIPAVEAQPASINDTLFQTAIKKYNIFYAAGNGNDAPPYAFKGAFLLAPTDFGGNIGLNFVPHATLLPSCDGDMSNLQGARTYDHNRFGPKDDTTPRYQIMVKGGNHNFYNTIWERDDHGTGKAYYCDGLRPHAVRLTAEGQQRGGKFIINSFMRYHVGGEQKFAAYWNGTGKLPEAACPAGKAACDEGTVLTVQKDAGRHKLIQRFDQADSMQRSLLGGVISFSGFDETASCDMPSGNAWTVGTCTPKRLNGFDYDGSADRGMLSIADHVQLAWSKPDAEIVTDITGLSTKGYDSLTFRLAVVHPIGQEALVTLTDSAGKTATIAASDFSDALYLSPRHDKRPLVNDPRNARFADGQVKSLLNMVAIPLKAFEGVDLTSLKELKLAFPKESGKVAITDIELQNLGRDKPDQKVATRQ